MARARLFWCLIGVVGLGALVWLLRPNMPTPLTIAESAAILYYNTPAAVQTGNAIHIGYVTMDGKIEVASFDKSTKAIVRTTIHDYGKPDDHAAPALWSDKDGLLIATAFHSSDLFLYRLLNNRVDLICEWKGKFSYPRFANVEGDTWLYIRDDPDRTGHLAVIKSPRTCASQQRIAEASTQDYIYATPPDGDRIAWSIWTRATNKHGSAFVNGTKLPIVSPDTMDEALMWSIADDYWSITQFRGAFRCCGIGLMRSELHKSDKLVFVSNDISSPFYPTGIVIAQPASEAIFPTEGRFNRRKLPDLKWLPTCIQDKKFNARSQFVWGGGSSYVWFEFDPPMGERDYTNAKIKLCMLD